MFNLFYVKLKISLFPDLVLKFKTSDSFLKYIIAGNPIIINTGGRKIWKIIKFFRILITVRTGF